MSPLATYQDVAAEIGLGRRGRAHLLLGNGFSISCDRRFCYDNLYDCASQNYSDKLKALFTLEGNNNFEGVLKIIDDSINVNNIYEQHDFNVQLEADKTAVRDSLIRALLETHMIDTTELSDAYKRSCGDFLKPYFNVFTTNYDLLLYWVERANEGLQGYDGFGNDENNDAADYVVFTERIGGKKGCFFLHGALHIYRFNGQLRKHTWCRTGTPLIEGIQEGFGRNQYPLFVAEGSSENKMRQIMSDPYLDYCLGKLGRIQDNLVTYGISFGDNDEHILKRIHENTTLRSIFIGLFGGEDSPDNIRIRIKFDAIEAERRNTRSPLTVRYYASETAQIWLPPA